MMYMSINRHIVDMYNVKTVQHRYRCIKMDVSSKTRLTLMEEFMKTFVGNSFHLILQQDQKYLLIDRIGIIEKTDESCPIKDLSIGDYFFQLSARNDEDQEASFLCNWSDEFIKNLLENYSLARNAGCKEILLRKDYLSNNSNTWSILWGNKIDRTLKTVSVNEYASPNGNQHATLPANKNILFATETKETQEPSWIEA